jgi:membrane associated rhomboid family serine protease
MLPIPTAASSYPSGSGGLDIQSAVRRWWDPIPWATSFFVALTLVCHLVSWALPIQYRCLNPQHAQGVAFFLAPFMHHDLFHFLFNVLALVNVGSSVEVHRLGTAAMLAFGFAVAYLSELVTILLAHTVLDAVLHEMCALGFSGVIFGLLAVDAYRGSSEGRAYSFFCFPIPVKYFPWFLLFVTSWLFPGSFFIGHLLGLLLGLLVAKHCSAGFISFFDLLVPLNPLPFGIRTPRTSAKYFLPPTDYSSVPVHPSNNSQESSFPAPGVAPPPTHDPFPGKGRQLGTGTV